ncbi:MAG: glycosyltransferase [Cyclobacteriaceae bacterium]|nr:glycosyltransferase [Cyclobacteriaceae bacterium]
MRGKHILYLTPDGLTDVLGQSQILPYLCGLAKAGYPITIISWEKKNRFQIQKPAVQSLCDQNKIVWHPLSFIQFPPLVAPLLNLYFMYQRALWVERKDPYQVVHCRSYLTSLVGVALKKRKKKKYLFDMRGFWADERRESNLWPASSFIYARIYQYFKKKERLFLEQADHVITLTNRAATEIRAWRIGTAPITVIPTCADLQHFDANTVAPGQQELRRQLEIPADAFVLLYLGSWGSWYLTEQMLQFYRALKAHTNAIFLVLTPDVTQVPLEPGVKAMEVNRTELPRYINLAQASVFFIQPTFSKMASAATKMGELLAMNVAVVTNKGWGDATEILSKHQAGILLNDFSDTEINLAVEQLLLGKPRTDLRAVAATYFDLEMGINKYQQVYAALTVV